MIAPDKRPLTGHGFAKRLILFLIPAVALAIGVVYVCDAIDPAWGDASGRWALLVAIFTSWQAARHWSAADREACAAKMPPTVAPPAPPAQYYYRMGPDGNIQGPETLATIQIRFPDTTGILIIEAMGQSPGVLKRSPWLPFPA